MWESLTLGKKKLKEAAQSVKKKVYVDLFFLSLHTSAIANCQTNNRKHDGMIYFETQVDFILKIIE